MKATIRIIQPSSKGGEDLIPGRIAQLESEGFNILYDEPSSSTPWPYTAGSINERSERFLSALLEPESQIILCARGGYGASDLLPHLPWAKLGSIRHKWIVGFSDISAIHAAFWTVLSWPGIHGPMPGSALWDLNSTEDIDFLLHLMSQSEKAGSIPLSPLNNIGAAPLQGRLFGGCMSVLCNLIGTPYFPQSLKDYYIFLEDTGENPGQLIRHWNQLIQSGALSGALGVIWGHLKNLDSSLEEEEVKRELAERSPIPAWSTIEFGHLSPNWSLVIGANAKLDSKACQLNWHFSSSME
ncbi:MAG: LD-carboxypeptidase [Oligoflexales bacterium]